MPDSEGCVVSLNGIRVRICRMRILMIEKGIRNARCYGEETRLSSVHALTHCGSSQPRFPSTVRLFRTCVPLFLIYVTLFRNCVPLFLIYVPLLSSVSLLASLPQRIRRRPCKCATTDAHARARALALSHTQTHGRAHAPALQVDASPCGCEQRRRGPVPPPTGAPGRCAHARTQRVRRTAQRFPSAAATLNPKP